MSPTNVGWVYGEQSSVKVEVRNGSHVAMSNVASSGEQEEGRVSPPSTSGNAQLIPPEPASVRCEEVEKVVLCMI